MTLGTPTHRPPLPPGIFWYSFLEAESTPGTWTCRMLRKKSPVTRPGIDPATFRLVRYPRPPLKAIVSIKFQGMCLLTTLGEGMLKYLRFKVIDLFIPERRKVISAIKSQSGKRYGNIIIKKLTIEKSYSVIFSYGSDCWGLLFFFWDMTPYKVQWVYV